MFNNHSNHISIWHRPRGLAHLTIREIRVLYFSSAVSERRYALDEKLKKEHVAIHVHVEPLNKVTKGDLDIPVILSISLGDFPEPIYLLDFVSIL